jgi:hypothetical protein
MITNRQVAEYAFLRDMYADGYFPDHLVDKGKAVLLRLCERIEADRPADLPALYALTHGGGVGRHPRLVIDDRTPGPGRSADAADALGSTLSPTPEKGSTVG